MAIERSITLTTEDGRSHPCHEDAPACSSVVVDGGAKCPTCAELHGIVHEYTGRVVALARPGRIEEAIKASAKEHGGKCFAEPPPATFRVRSNATPAEDYDTLTGPAECARCRTRVGTLVVKVPTMWGIEEDRRVLHGRARVY